MIPNILLLALFWVHQDKMDLVSPPAEPVMAGANTIARATIHGRVIGGRVSLPGYFLAALDGKYYKLNPPENSRFEVCCIYNGQKLCLTWLICKMYIYMYVGTFMLWLNTDIHLSKKMINCMTKYRAHRVRNMCPLDFFYRFWCTKIHHGLCWSG